MHSRLTQHQQVQEGWTGREGRGHRGRRRLSGIHCSLLCTRPLLMCALLGLRAAWAERHELGCAVMRGAQQLEIK